METIDAIASGLLRCSCECRRAGFVFTVTVKVAGVPLTVGVTEAGLIPQVVPVGAPLHDKETESANPFSPVTLIATVPEFPTPTERELVARVALKSPIFNWAEADRVATPLDNATVKV